MDVPPPALGSRDRDPAGGGPPKRTVPSSTRSRVNTSCCIAGHRDGPSANRDLLRGQRTSNPACVLKSGPVRVAPAWLQRNSSVGPAWELDGTIWGRFSANSAARCGGPHPPLRIQYEPGYEP